MRAMTILSVAMFAGMLCLPAAAAKKLRPSWMVVTLDDDANGEVVTGVGADANADLQLVRPDLGYVGVHLGPVPAAVASQLRLQGKGVMIRNVAKDSPAYSAGLDRYDVITMIGKDKPVQTAQQFVRMVRKLKQGDVLDLAVLRGGRQKPVAVTLGKRPAGQIAYIYEEDPDDQVKDEFSIRRGMLRKKDGKWIFETPDGKPVELPLPQILKAMPNKAWGNIHVQTRAIGDANNTRQISITSVTNGKTLSVKSLADDKIEVTRKKPDGKSKTDLYDNADQLKQKDKEAFDLYRSVWYTQMKLGSGGVGMSMIRRIKPMVQVGEDAGVAAAEVQAAAEKLQAELERHVRELAEKTSHEAQAARGRIARVVAPVSRQFDVDESGRIKVRIQKGGDEVSILFASQDEMKKQNPKLYQEYRKLLDSDKAGQ